MTNRKLKNLLAFGGSIPRKLSAFVRFGPAKSGLIACLIFSVLFFNITLLTAQELEDREGVYQSFDKIVGIENSGVIEGFEYVEQHRMINDRHKFFKTYDFVPGTVFYDDQPYFDIDIKYNVFQDILLVQIPDERGKIVFQPFENRLDGFILQNRRFENVKPVEAGPELAGIYEVLFKTGNLKVLKKHLKKEKTLLDRDVPYYEFTDDTPQYFYWAGDGLQPLSRSNLTEKFPEEKSDIRYFYRRNRKQARDNPDVFMQNLFKMLSDRLKDQ